MSKDNIQSFFNYHEIELICHNIKVWERIIENKLRQTVIKNQFGFILR